VLLDLYGKHQSIEEAQNLFNRMLVRDRIAWNSIIGAYAQHGCSAEAVHVFRRMCLEIIPDKITHISIMSALTGDHNTGSVHCKQIHVEILYTQSEIDTSVGTALISMYGRCGSIQYAERVFQEIRARDLVTWTAFAAISDSLVATQLFDRILLECHIPDQGCCVGFLSTISAGESLSQGKRMHAWLLHTKLGADVTINNALLSLYGKCGGIEDAEKMFYNMSDCNAISWNALLSVYNLHGRSSTLLVSKMLCRCYMPDVITWTSSLTSCAEETRLAEGKQVHARISSKQSRTDSVVTTALILLYGRCGDLERSRKMFLDLEAPNPVSWNAMIAVYAQHGLAQEALDVFKRMEIENMVPDEATFVSILAACSHDGLLLEACASFFAPMIDNNVASPSADHVLCIIDLLGRAGRLDEAESLVNALPPEDMAATYFLVLLGSCRYQFDVERGERIALQAFELDSEIPASYVLLSNLYCNVKE
jgi:pentatricopeptide repeat protein